MPNKPHRNSLFTDIDVRGKAPPGIEILSATIDFASGVTEANASLLITSDGNVIMDRRVSLILVNAQGGVIGKQNEVTINIRNQNCKYLEARTPIRIRL